MSKIVQLKDTDGNVFPKLLCNIRTIQTGVTTFFTSSATTMEHSVTFPKAFKNNPYIILIPTTPNKNFSVPTIALKGQVTDNRNGFTLVCKQPYGASLTNYVYWIAIEFN